VTHAWPKLSESLKSKTLSLESLWLVVEINDRFANVFNKERTHETFGRKKLICPEFLQDVSALFMVAIYFYLLLFRSATRHGQCIKFPRVGPGGGVKCPK
jgi:hypothetical protein